MDQIFGAISEHLVLIGLFIIFMVGYKLACHGFKPKPLIIHRKTDLNKAKSIDYHKKHKNVSLKDVGLDDLTQPRNLPANIKRNQESNRLLRAYSEKSPNTAANVLKAWLHEMP